MPLTDAAVRNAKPDAKPIKLFDGDGLFLLVTPNGGKWWRLKYRLGGKEKLLSLGTYPEVSLKDARQKRDDIRKQLATGIDPSAARRAAKAVGTEVTDTFEVIAREWFARYEPTWAPNHASKIITRLEHDVFPWIGSQAIGGITAADLLMVARRIEARGAVETAHRAVQNCGQIFRYAIATGRADRATQQLTYVGRSPRSRKNTMPVLPSPGPLGTCCGLSLVTRAPWW